ncbi:MAG TPA: hypothetical protein VF421_08900 [Niabella sp.]
MKKLKLNLFNLKDAEVLTREQLKNVIGGDDGGSDEWPTCLSDWDCGTRQVRCPNGDIQTSNGKCYSTTGSVWDMRCHYGFSCQPL